MDAEENQKQVSHRAHSPWKSQRRDFHIPTAPTTKPDGKVEIQEQDFHFPTGLFVFSKTKRKEDLAADG